MHRKTADATEPGYIHMKVRPIEAEAGRSTFSEYYTTKHNSSV